MPARVDARRTRPAARLAALGLAWLVVAAWLPAGAAAAAASSSLDGATVTRTLKDPDIVESSGLARSRYSDTRLWTHNDSGGGSTIYAIGRTGRTTATYELADAIHWDWEGMASAKRDGVSYLYLGDIGDNRTQRSSIFVHRVREPRPWAPDGSLNPRTYELRYPDGAHDAETLMVRPRTLRLYVVSKVGDRSGAIYVAPRTLSTQQPNRLRRIASAPSGLTDGVFLDRHRFVLRGYRTAWLYRSIGGRSKKFSLPSSGESITSAWRRNHIFIGSEGRYSDIWRVRLP